MRTKTIHWEYKKIKDIGVVVTGSTPSMKIREYYGSHMPWVTAADFQGKYIKTSKIKLSEQGITKARVVPKGSILITCIASIGLNAIADVDLATNQQINSIIVKNEYDNEFIYYLMNYHSEELKRIAGKTAVPIINKREFENYKISCPELIEQKRIAKILSPWDKAIETIDKLIEAKKKLKQALMQTLLTGQIRFPGFGKPITKIGEMPEGWGRICLSDVADIIVSNVDKKSFPEEKQVLLCNYLDVYQNSYIESSLSFMSATASDEEIRKFKVKKSDILITKDSETADDIGVPAYVAEDINSLVCGYHLAIIRSKVNYLYPIFLYMALKLQEVSEQFSRLANGVTRFGLAVDDIGKVLLSIPQLSEQKKIAEILNKADKEIKTLEKFRTDYIIQKRGIMQLFFTKRN